jgi:hypothetical protein
MSPADDDDAARMVRAIAKAPTEEDAHLIQQKASK